MSQSLNLCQFIGNLGRDPETRYSADGAAITTISVGCNWKTKSAEGTEWVRIVAFGKLAEIMGEHLRKGAKVYVSGRMTTRKWQDKDGADKFSTEIVADQLLMLSPKAEESDKAKEDRQERKPAQKPQKQSSMDDMDDDIPF